MGRIALAIWLGYALILALIALCALTGCATGPIHAAKKTVLEATTARVEVMKVPMARSFAAPAGRILTCRGATWCSNGWFEITFDVTAPSPTNVIDLMAVFAHCPVQQTNTPNVTVWQCDDLASDVWTICVIQTIDNLEDVIYVVDESAGWGDTKQRFYRAALEGT